MLLCVPSLQSSLWSLYYRHPLWLVNKSSFPPLLCTHPLLLVMTWWACMFSAHFLLYTSTSCLLKNFNSQVWKSTYRICCCWKPWPWANFFSSAWSIRTSSRLDVFHFRSQIRSAVWKATLSVPSLFSCLLVSRHCLARLKKFLPSCVVHITTSGEHAYTFPCCIHERAALVKCTAGPEKFLFATTGANRFLF